MPLLTLWIGYSYAERAIEFVIWLALGAFVRNAMLSYVVIALGCNRQGKMVYGPIIEGFTAIFLGYLLIVEFGAIGLAYAKICAGFVAICIVILQHVLSDIMPTISRSKLVLINLIKPMRSAVPAVSVYALCLLGEAPEVATSIMTIFTSAICVIFVNFERSDRQRVTKFLGKTSNSREDADGKNIL
jgi:hypothetical protein